MRRGIISVGDKGSFVVEDVLSQAHKVISLIISTNNLHKSHIETLLSLQSDIINNRFIPKLTTGNDTGPWHELLPNLDRQRWFDHYHHGVIISYFHRLLLDKVDYFTTHKDPYHKIKTEMLESFLSNTHKWNTLKTTKEIHLGDIFDGMLWGNKCDKVPMVIAPAKVILVDQRNQVLQFLWSEKHAQIDIVADNVGEELVYDLMFIAYLFDQSLVEQVRLHVKNYPYTVSDATKQDVFDTLFELNRSNTLIFKELAHNINEKIKTGILRIQTYPFTTLGLDRSKASNIIMEIYKGSSLLITKGDFNYRKNVGWRYWQPTDHYDEIVSYLGIPLLCFRTVKNEIIVGIEDLALLKNVEKYGNEWWKRGIGGMILFSKSYHREKLLGKPINPYWQELCS